ncbi:hypothetical protein [Sporisorium scitamineum]|uniref:Transposase domain-containing protein n=1 Tax=Sporisorium scitamineum TaxID=49012 RepID=A0A0F7S688_9BASI|nr:hypothetical protein [Sporisorium scitamineum]
MIRSHRRLKQSGKDLKRPTTSGSVGLELSQETSFDTGGDLQDSQAVWQNADEEEEEDHITSESDGTDWEDDSGNEESNFDSDFEDYFDGSRDAPVDLAHPARAMPPRLLDMEDGRLVTLSAVAAKLGLKDHFMRYLVCTESRCEQLNLWDGTVPPSGTMHCQFCGRKVRARLNMVAADSPARAKTVDFVCRFWRDPICPYCPKKIDNFGDVEPWEDRSQEPQPPPPATETAAHCKNTVLKQLGYFDLVLDSPPDPMHAVLSGMCQRFWWDFLLDGCGNIGSQGSIEKVQFIVKNARLPSIFKKLDERMGDRSAGPPSAEQWVTMYRCLLPFIMLSLWDRSLINQRDQVLNFDSTKGSAGRPVSQGYKQVRDIFPIGLLLCCIVELLEKDLDESGVEELRGYIVRYNVLLKNLLGNGWLTFSVHITEHIPDAIRRFGAARNFSCLPFERANGKLGRISTSGHRQVRYLRTIAIPTYPSATRITSAGSSRNSNLDNSYGLIRTQEGNTEPVLIRWLFEKAFPLQGRGTTSTTERFMHVRKLKIASLEEAMGGDVQWRELLDRMRIRFAFRMEDGEEKVVPFADFVSKLAVVPFNTDYRIQSEVYGLKAL